MTSAAALWASDDSSERGPGPGSTLGYAASLSSPVSVTDTE